MIVYPTGTSAKDFGPGSYPDYSNNERYRCDLSRQKVISYLLDIKCCVRDDRFIVLENDEGRGENRAFLNAYGLYRRPEQKSFLLSLDVDEFCHVKLTNDGRELYVFCAARSLYKSLVGERRVQVYVKHDYDDRNRPFDTVVSMHELNMPIELAFVD